MIPKGEAREFIENCCWTHGAGNSLVWVIYGRYKAWAKYKDRSPMPESDFVRSMSLCGYKRKFIGACWVFVGIGVNPNPGWMQTATEDVSNV